MSKRNRRNIYNFFSFPLIFFITRSDDLYVETTKTTLAIDVRRRES